jgi:hypothetical protein
MKFVDKIYCISTLREDRFFNILQNKRDLLLDIEIIYPSNTHDPRYSFNSSFLQIIKKHVGSDLQILILEDDFFTDLTLGELERKLQDVIIPNSWKVLSLGSTNFNIEKIDDFLIRTDSFGYCHSMIFNMKNIDKKWIELIEVLIEEKKHNFDILLNELCYRLGEKIYSLKESIFIQRDFSSLSSITGMFKSAFRHLRDSEVLDFYEVLKIEKNRNSKNINDWGFRIDESFDFFMEFKNLIEIKDDLIFRTWDYYSGSYSFTHFNVSSNFWVSFPSFTQSFVVEISSNSKIYFRKSYDINKI